MAKFLFLFKQNDKDWEYWVSEHMRVSGAYWSLTGIPLHSSFFILHLFFIYSSFFFHFGNSALSLINSLPSKEEQESIVNWILKCQQEDGLNHF